RTIAAAGVETLNGWEPKRGTLRLFDAATGRRVRELTGHGDQVYQVTFTADGKTLLSGSMDGTLRVWDVATGKQLRQAQWEWGALALSPDGKVLARRNGDQVELCELLTGNVLARLEAGADVLHDGFGPPVDHRAQPIAFSPDGKALLMQDGTGLRLCDVASG